MATKNCNWITVRNTSNKTTRIMGTTTTNRDVVGRTIGDNKIMIRGNIGQ